MTCDPGWPTRRAANGSATWTPLSLCPRGPGAHGQRLPRSRPHRHRLECWGHVVITGRVTDASLVVGPAMWAFGWGPHDLDPIAGAVAAGHVIECGAQCTGGNFAFFDEVDGLERPGFPIAEVLGDGSAVITKHPGTGGAVTVDTVTAQLLYEIAGPRYLSPDAVARFDTIGLDQVGPDRVLLSGTKGEPPPPTLKVAANLTGGWRNSMTLVLTGGQVAEKAALAASLGVGRGPGGRSAFDETGRELAGDLSGQGLALLRLAVRGQDRALVGRAFSSAVVETTLAGYPGNLLHLGADRRFRGGPRTGPPPWPPPPWPSRFRSTGCHWPRRHHRQPRRAIVTMARPPGGLDERPCPDRGVHRGSASGGAVGRGARWAHWSVPDRVIREVTPTSGYGHALARSSNGYRSHSARRFSVSSCPRWPAIRSSATPSTTSKRSTSSFTGSWDGGWLPTSGSTPRPRGWPSFCAPAGSRHPEPPVGLQATAPGRPGPQGSGRVEQSAAWSDVL